RWSSVNRTTCRFVIVPSPGEEVTIRVTNRTVRNSRRGPLVIIPDGPLCYLPFQLLVDRDDRYLAETHRVRYAPSLTTLHLTRKWAEDRARRGELPDRPLYAVGDPDYGPPPARPELVDTVALLARLEGRTRGEAFAPLEHSGRELAAVP